MWFFFWSVLYARNNLSISSKKALKNADLQCPCIEDLSWSLHKECAWKRWGQISSMLLLCAFLPRKKALQTDSSGDLLTLDCSARKQRSHGCIKVLLAKSHFFFFFPQMLKYNQEWCNVNLYNYLQVHESHLTYSVAIYKKNKLAQNFYCYRTTACI